MIEGEAKSTFADGLVDDLLPEDMDWRRLVCGYPTSALIISCLGGFFLGSRHGTEIVKAFSSFLSREVDRNISTFLGDDDAQG